MFVLVACECSQQVTLAFRLLGHVAFSCDLVTQYGGHPEWHIVSDVLPLLSGFCSFTTEDGASHLLSSKWDLIIAHPPCTYLSNAAACRLYPQKGKLNLQRYEKGLEAKRFFMYFYNLDLCDRICIENPIPSKVFSLPPYSQIIQPYYFGDPYSKKTCLWLKGLPPLKPTNILSEYKPYVSCGTSRNKGNPDKAGVSRKGGAAKVRSKTFPGIASAMASQWGSLCAAGVI